MDAKKEAGKSQPIAFLQESLLTARAADRRRQPSKNVTETGQCWKRAKDGVQEIFVDSVAQFAAAAESLDMQSHVKWGRSGYVFRGLPNCTWELLTSLMRCGKSHDHARKVELPIARSFQRYTSAGSVALPQPCSSNIWGLLAYMQHHGSPTRLLDWTYSALVALHFATIESAHTEVDAVVWCAQPHEINFSSSLGKGLPKFQWLPSIDDVSRTIHGYHAASMPDEIIEFESALVKLQQVGEKQKDHFAIFFEAPSIDQRIVGQCGLFSMTSDASLSINSILSSPSNAQFVRRIRIASRAKRLIRQRLDGLFGITERVLFPGADGLSQFLARWYNDEDEKIDPVGHCDAAAEHGGAQKRRKKNR
jgi:hypothetical protein